MNKTIVAPRTLTEAIKYFADQDVALTFMAGIRWPEGVTCPHCGGADPSFLSTRRIWKCKACRKQFSVKVGTIFEDSPIPLSKWLPALWMLANCKNGISSYELARALGVTQKTAWFMLHRVRLAMQSRSFQKIDGEVEADETYIGGSARFMHAEKRKRVIRGRTGTVGKIAVMGLLKRGKDKKHSMVRTALLENIRTGTVQRVVRSHVAPGAELFTDELSSYNGLDRDYIHKVINHGEAYAKGKVHTNGLENFWSLLKRGIRGTYVSVEPFHLFRYLDEQVHRFNTRKTSDVARFIDTVRRIVGKRLTYANLTGAHLDPATT